MELQIAIAVAIITLELILPPIMGLQIDLRHNKREEVIVHNIILLLILIL